MSSNSKGLATFILGAALGLAIGYFMNSDDKDELISSLKDKAGKIKDSLKEQLEKGKDLIGKLGNKTAEVTDNL
ncbi:MAG TPA: YtxH domain-containing protein [Chitinophagaceae bacterium]|nr:YtxH domain-containing protein [Chitinophagaceae bacterium]